MNREIHHLAQGTQEWAAHRAGRLNASEAAAMLGVSRYQTRSELLREKATGETREVAAAQQRIFDDGHRFEAMARPIAEEIIGEELYSPTVSVEVDGLKLSASYDGVTLLEDVIWEHKTLNQELKDALSCGVIPDQYKPQLEQQLLVIGAEKCLFMASAGDRESMRHAWYESDPGLRKRLLDGWQLFAKDLESYQPPADAPQVVGRAPENLPALRIEVQGMVKASNLAQFQEHALAVFSGINTDLQTDEDFANAEQTVKWCADVEGRLDAAKDHALSQTESIDDLFRTIDAIREEARAKRLELDKLVKARKQAIRGEIMQEAKTALNTYIDAIDATLPDGLDMPYPAFDFAGVMKGKKTVKSLRDAVDQELARAKIESTQVADGIRANLKTLAELAPEHRFLFSDLQRIVTKPAEDFAAVVKARLAEHQAAEENRLDAERERIREEEQARIAKEAERPAAPAKTEPERKQTPKAPANVKAPLTEYERGYVDGLREYAYWKDGVQYVGSMGKTLDEAIDRFLQRKVA